MYCIAALNDSVSNTVDDESSRQPHTTTKEAQEAEAFALHRQALELQQEGKEERSKEVLHQLLNHPFLEQCEKSPAEHDGVMLPAHQLMYSAYKNLALLAMKNEDWNTAMEHYIEAVAVDDSDVTVWYRIGNIALKIHNYPLARHGFEEALKCNPKHWPSLDKIITVLYVLGDYANCLYFISRAFSRDSGYVKGLCFMNQIFEEHPGIQADTAHFFKDLDQSVFQTEVEQEEIYEFVNEAMEMRKKKQELCKPPVRPKVKLLKRFSGLTWKDLGENLIELYDHVNKIAHSSDPNKPRISLARRVDLTEYANVSLEQALQIIQTSLPSTSKAVATTSSNSAEPMDTQETDSHAPETEKQNDDKAAEKTSTDDNAAAPSGNTDGDGESAQAEEEPSDTADHSATTSPITKQHPGLMKKAPKRKQKDWWVDEAIKRRTPRALTRDKRGKKTEEEKLDYRKVIKKILPQALLKVDETEKKPDTPECRDSPKPAEEESMDVDAADVAELKTNENEDVLEFLKKNQVNCGVVGLLNNFLIELSKKEKLKWYSGVSTVYIKIYERLRPHFSYPSFLCKDETDETIRDMAIMGLIYCELALDVCLNTVSPTSSSSKAKLIEDFAGDAEYLTMLTAFHCILGDTWRMFAVRVFWMRARYMALENNSDMAVVFFEKVRY